MGAGVSQRQKTVSNTYQIHAALFWKMGVEIVVTAGETVRVSVAMVTYNGGRYLRQQLDSVLEQLGDQDELVVSDDGSEDDTLLILREYQRRDKKIRILEGPGKGIKKNVEHAVLGTRGSYIFLADQDDIWLPGKVERILQVFQEQKVSVVVHDAKRTVIPVPAQIEMHDQWIGVLGDYFAGEAFFLPDALLLYRRHGDNNSAMSRYGLCRMVRNRLVFLWHFGKRILYLRRKNSC